MKLDVAYFVLAIVLLWVPRQFLRLGARIQKSSHRSRITNPRDNREPGDASLGFHEEFKKPRNYLDFLRSAAASLCLVYVCIEIGTGAPTTARQGAFLLQVGILAIGVVIQTIRWEQRLALYAPVFFVAGTGAGLCGPEAAIYGFALTWVLNALLPSPGAFLVVEGLCIAGFGALFHRALDKYVIASLLIALMPVMVSGLTKHPLTRIGRRIRT